MAADGDIVLKRPTIENSNLIPTKFKLSQRLLEYMYMYFCQIRSHGHIHGMYNKVEYAKYPRAENIMIKYLAV